MEERGLAVARWWNIFQAFEKWWAVVSERRLLVVEFKRLQALGRG